MKRPGTEILALHGFTGVGADFAPFAELCGLGPWHCPNLPGHGRDPSLDCSPEATLRLVEAERSSFNAQAATSKILLGYSMGARAALLHAVTHPEAWDALILISPSPGLEDEAARAARRQTDEKLAARIEADGVAAFLDFWQNTPMIRSQQHIRADWYAAMRTHRRQHQAAGLAASLRQFGQGSCPDLWPQLGTLSMPVLLLTGSLDTKYGDIAARMARQLGHCQWTDVPGAGHMPHLEAPDASCAAIAQFLEG
jgi:2-succinyl-6-hydroxy-2,4-cyclohexadiene-1-carboxylate synthase